MAALLTVADVARLASLGETAARDRDDARSQHQNRRMALALLAVRVAQHETEAVRRDLAAAEAGRSIRIRFTKPGEGAAFVNAFAAAHGLPVVVGPQITGGA